jgi:cytochrome P450
LRSQAERCAIELLPRVSIAEWMHSLSARVLGTLLGCAGGELDRLAQDVGRFVAALSPLATAEQRDAGNAAVLDLLLFVRRVQGAGFVADLHRSAVDAGWDDDMVLVANAVGLFSQAYEATAGWIGNALVALERTPQLEKRLRDDPGLLPDFIDEVNRHDPSVQNTRRFVAAPALVQGKQLQPGDAILLVLASANRDSAFNPNGEAFELERAERRCLNFGSSSHACPGDKLARAIVQGAIAAWLASGRVLPRAEGYRPSVNGRIPRFET